MTAIEANVTTVLINPHDSLVFPVVPVVLVDVVVVVVVVVVVAVDKSMVRSDKYSLAVMSSETPLTLNLVTTALLFCQSGIIEISDACKSWRIV
jgi:hypothetical protein